ncbi:MAG: GNAT family N-acetyltransferase [Paracoccaceae bacterium]
MSDLFDVTDATWPAAAVHKAGAFRIREGRGGGQRVSAATARHSWTKADIDRAETVQQQLCQPALFMIRPGDEALDAELSKRGYAVKDPVNLYVTSIPTLLNDVAPPLSAFVLWPPLAIMRDIWAEGGIGPDRIAVMERAAQPKTAILGRINDRVSGVAFVAVHDSVAMLHALHVVPEQRRHGAAVRIVRRAAEWAHGHGAKSFAVLVTCANLPANALYASLGMEVVGQYHYRTK